MNNIRHTFDIVMAALEKHLGDSYLSYGLGVRPGPTLKFKDIHVIALSLTQEYLGIHSELDLFTQLKHCKNLFPNLISRRQYSDRRKALKEKVKELQDTLKDLFPVPEKIYVIDSTPARVCRIARWRRNKLGKNRNEIEPNVGYCAAQQEKYFGYKLHVICTPEGIVKDYYLTKATYDDKEILFREEVLRKYSYCTIVGDKGYLNDKRRDLLNHDYNINLQYPYRSNMKNKVELPKDLAYKRKRIETIFSQLTEQFNIKRNLAKSFRGYMTRLYSKICSYTLIQYINNFLNNKPIGLIKNALI